ncbi:MAG: glycosyltransferase [Granulosicoccus sp.]
MFRIDRITWVIVGLVGVLLAASWAFFNRPDHLPQWPEVINGVSFSPFRPGQSPQGAKFPSEQQILDDLTLLSDRIESVRTYTVEKTLGSVPRLAASVGLDVMVGIWISDDLRRNWQEIDSLKTILAQNRSNISAIVVGNEVLLRREMKAEKLAQYVDYVRDIAGNIPVTVAETWDIWLKNPQLANHVDFVTAHVLPYWEGIPAWRSPDYVFERYDQLREQFRHLPVILGEVGWPSEGRQRFGADPSLPHQAAFLRQFLQTAESRGTDYFILEAFDQIWKTDEGEVGRYWGIFNAEREPKFPFVEPVTRVPDWHGLVALTLVSTVLLLAVLLRDSHGLAHSGRGFLVIVAYAVSTTVVWVVYKYTQKYMTWDQILVGMALMMCFLCIATILLTEAHEWAESIWNRRCNTTVQRSRDVGKERKVSIHIPTHNEPPEMVIETLSALRALDYDNFEVLIVDNNTADPAIWLPVQQWCEQQDERFRFFHLNPLSGFKAGALNYALQQTAEDAELIAVIDSDYVVDRDWLRDCTPGFDNEEVAIVQAPQDYRDDRQSLFKSMIYSEYAGFFGIGMVNRNARNAIIQHGTMTIVRRNVLEHIDGWSQWCITEDAELGLRILENGYRAAYIPRSYGRGLMPDNFLDYKKQRFRWAYGSVLILRHHLRYLLSARNSRLTTGQRYHFIAGWLPWMTDGLCLLFNCIALFYAVLMVVFPYYFYPPEVMLSLLPIGYFVFKMTKMLVLYRCRMRAGLKQGMSACIAGLALSHTIGRAMLAGLYTSSIGFFRTPKTIKSQSLLQALNNAREEALLAIALILAAITISLREDAYLLDTRLWITLLIVQSIPYLAAVSLSIISALNARPRQPEEQAAAQTLLGQLPDSVIQAER